LLLARESYALDMHAVIAAAAKHHVALEINAHPQRLDLDWRWCKAAADQGVTMSIGLDAHEPEELTFTPFGLGVARKGWLAKKDVLNCLDVGECVKRKA
jgi:DNA polymerase (family 10)